MYYEHPDKDLCDLKEMADQYVQAKLKISQPNDPAELEADSIANEILHGTNDIQKQEDEENLENKNKKTEQNKNPEKSIHS